LTAEQIRLICDLMKILVVGGGGREHALVWKLSLSPSHPEIFCAPGNAGTAELATNVDLAAEDVPGLLGWARQHRPDLTVVGPEAPLCAGLTDRLEAEGLAVFGPSQKAAQIEGSKIFSKDVMLAGGVPTAAACSFDQADAAREYVRSRGGATVIKADGLAAGKGVYVCDTPEQAEKAIDEIMVACAYGDAGKTVVVEDRLEGEEASILALVDGQTVVMLASAQDHKRVFDDDKGPNTGGMGAYSPAPVITDELWPVIRAEVFDRTLAELRKRGIVFKGVLYAGLMITAEGPRVLEFNCRFGDPETQAILPRMRCDFAAVLDACARGTLKEDMIAWDPSPCVCVVMAAGGYPARYARGKEIAGLDRAAALEGVAIFHAGTKKDGSAVVTSGGRVLGVTARGATFVEAVKEAYVAVARVRFADAQFRTDIGRRALTMRRL